MIFGGGGRVRFFARFDRFRLDHPRVVWRGCYGYASVQILIIYVSF